MHLLVYNLKYIYTAGVGILSRAACFDPGSPEEPHGTRKHTHKAINKYSNN